MFQTQSSPMQPPALLLWPPRKKPYNLCEGGGQAEGLPPYQQSGEVPPEGALRIHLLLWSQREELSKEEKRLD